MPTLPPKVHHYTFIGKIGTGRFGSVYRGKNDKTGEPVAIKIERDSPSGLNILKHETTIMNYLYNHACRNIPTIYWYGRYAECPALVMPHYEYSLFDMFTKSSPPAISVFLQPAVQKIHLTKDPHRVMYSIIQIIQTIHNAGVVHRDLKPQNFMVKNAELYLIDFGMSTFYVDENSNHIAEPPPKTHLLGTLKYISYHVHCGCEYTRRDDLISLGYLYMFLCGVLFWEDVQFDNTTPEIYPETHLLYPKNKIMKAYKHLDRIDDCFHKNEIHQPEIREYLRYVYGLRFSETPDYTRLLSTIYHSIGSA